jgi:hypothetical protein
MNSAINVLLSSPEFIPAVVPPNQLFGLVENSLTLFQKWVRVASELLGIFTPKEFAQFTKLVSSSPPESTFLYEIYQAISTYC